MAHISENFIQHIEQQLPEHIKLEEFIAACQRPLRKSFRANLLKTDTQALQSLFEAEGYQLNPIPWCEEGFWVDESHKTLPENLGNWLPHLQGQLYIQEASSMLPVKALLHDFDYSGQSTFLDMAAAPGSKTTQLAARLNNQGQIVANELSSTRLKGLSHNIQRCGVVNTALSHNDGTIFGAATPEYFDAILLDAPCGGEGTVRKDEQALNNWSLDKVVSISELQKELITSAYHALKPGGRLVYSTCTLSQEENHAVCQHLLTQFPDNVTIKPLNDLFEGAEKAATAEGYLHVFPNTYDCEGFFVACFDKGNAMGAAKENNHNQTQTKVGKFSKISDKNFESVNSYSQIFGWDLSPIKANLYTKTLRNGSEEVWLLDDAMLTFNNILKLNRFGSKLFELNKHGPKIQHQAIISYGQELTKQSFSLNEKQAQEYLQGRDIFLEDSNPPKHKEVIVRFNEVSLGLAKHLGNKLKNNLPRDLVRDKVFITLD